MNPADVPRYMLRDGDAAADRDTLLGIWAGNLGHDVRMPAKYDWFYRRSPHGAPLMQLLYHGEDAAGTCAAGIREFMLGERHIQAGVLVDLAVLPEHRSLGPAMLLQQGLVSAADRQLDLLYGFPNPKAAPVFKRMGYTHAVDMVRYVRILRHANYLARRLPRSLALVVGSVLDGAYALRRWISGIGRRKLRISLHDAADARMAALCMQQLLPDTLTCRRTLSHLQWRLDAAPQGRFRYATMVTPGSDRMLAWACWRDDGQAATVMDFWSEAPEKGFPPTCIEAFCNALRREGHASVQVEMATSPARLANWLAGRFVARGTRPFYLRWRDPPVHAVDMHITSADEDE